MKIDGYTEITEEEFDILGPHNGVVVYNSYEGEDYYFKKDEPKQEFPIVFKDSERRIEITEDGIIILNMNNDESILFNKDYNFPLLLEAVKKAQEIFK